LLTNGKQMPTYIYKCYEHGDMELRLPVDHEPPTCPHCGAVMVRKYTPTVAIYKGKGFTKGNGNDD
jgi:putative FmdB family regulatory protein